MGVGTASNASPETMATNIKSISTGYTKTTIGWIGLGYSATLSVTSVLSSTIYTALTASNFVAISYRLLDYTYGAIGPDWRSGKIPSLSYVASTGALTLSSYYSTNAAGSTGDTYGLALQIAAIY